MATDRNSPGRRRPGSDKKVHYSYPGSQLAGAEDKALALDVDRIPAHSYGLHTHAPSYDKGSFGRNSGRKKNACRYRDGRARGAGRWHWSQGQASKTNTFRSYS